jgi:L-xylulokinase
MADRYLLGTDNGCTVAKAALFGLDGREVAAAARKVEIQAPRPGWHEMDMDAIWQATAASIREVLEYSGIPPVEIACVAPTGHGNGLYLVDERGRGVRPAIASTDSRARKILDGWLAEKLDAQLRPKTMQAMWPAQPNALLAWLLAEEPESLERAHAVLMCKDYIRARLGGELRAEITDFSGTSLLDVGRGAYDPELLERYGIGELQRLLPPLVESSALSGAVSATAAAETGLAEGTPLAGGMFDIDACGLACGLVDEGPLCMIAGTWGNNQYIAREPVVDEAVFMTSRYAIPGWYLMLEGSATSASNLEWLLTEFFPAERARGNVYALADQLVAETRPEDAGIVFLPYLYGSNESLDAKACFFGLDGWQRRGHLLRALYEGVVFAHEWHVQRLLRFRPMPSSIRLAGGAARSTVWTQIFADIFQVPVEVPSGSELGALGAAICAAVAVGIYPDFPRACEAMVRFDRRVEPDRGRAALYDEKRARSTRVREAMAPLWSELRWTQDTTNGG